MQAGIDGVQLVHLTRQGLLGLGVDKEEHIKCLLDHVSVLRIQWERSLRAACQGQPTDMPSGFDASWRSESADGQCTRTKHRARMVWPRVGSPILRATFRGSRQNDEECQKELHDAACKVREPCRQPEVGKDEAQDCQQGAKTESKDSKESYTLQALQAGTAVRTSGPNLSISNHDGNSYASAQQTTEIAGLSETSIPLPSHRSSTPLSGQGVSSGRCGSEVMSRCSSAPNSCRKRGPSAAAADGASLFLSDQSRGACFGTTTRGVEVLPDSLGPGPACYDAHAAKNRISSRVVGSTKFSTEPRRTMECMFQRGASGPGSGKYRPPQRSTSRGGSFPRAPRWGSRSGSAPLGMPRLPGGVSPGPCSYKPNHAALSTLC